jgi:hypothetical protein
MSGRAWVTRACALWAIAWTSLVAAAGGGWHYTIDQARREQQANFCDNKKIIEEIAAVFERFGPRSGYAALSDSPGCAIAVRSFTPRSILLTVTISKGEAGEYRVRFVEVENERGDILYLVTTRDVAAR